MPSTHEHCRITTGAEAGHTAITLENDLLRVTVLPEKGADIYRFVYKPLGIDFLWKNPVGLYPPGAPPHEGSGDLAFLHNYEGCWQELFPSCNDPTEYNGAHIPFHGEVALLPWRSEVLTHTADALAVRFSVDTRATHFRLERTMRLNRGEARLILDETVTNTGGQPQHFVWGHHCVVGGPWLEAGCQLDTGAQTITTIPVAYEAETARLAPGQREPFPVARLAEAHGGGSVDLRVIPGVEAHSHDDVYLTDLREGFAAVRNPRLGLQFSLHWDPSLFRWIISWQPYGGAEALPFKGMPYAVGIEPWISSKALGEAVQAGEALLLAPGSALHTTLEARVTVG